MPKRARSKSRDPEQPQAPFTANSANADVPPPPDGGTPPDDDLREGDAVILGMDCTSKPSPARQRQTLIVAANAGDANAQLRMGDICRTGDEFTAQDYAEALSWYRLAAEQGHPNAQNNFGAMHQHGTGIPVGMEEAVKWYRKAAGRDLAIAQLGTLYQVGNGVERNIPFAAELHTIAAMEGEVESAVRLADYREELESEALSGKMLACLCLGRMFDRGLGVGLSKPTMYAWLQFGERYGSRNEDPGVLEELLDMRGFYGIVLPDTDKDDALDLLNTLATRRTHADAPQPDPDPLRQQHGGH